jgi:hypothetical protein
MAVSLPRFSLENQFSNQVKVCFVSVRFWPGGGPGGDEL